jgi:hypothetical protein
MASQQVSKSANQQIDKRAFADAEDYTKIGKIREMGSKQRFRSSICEMQALSFG